MQQCRTATAFYLPRQARSYSEFRKHFYHQQWKLRYITTIKATSYCSDFLLEYSVYLKFVIRKPSTRPLGCAEQFGNQLLVSYKHILNCLNAVTTRLLHQILWECRKNVPSHSHVTVTKSLTVLLTGSAGDPLRRNPRRSSIKTCSYGVSLERWMLGNILYVIECNNGFPQKLLRVALQLSAHCSFLQSRNTHEKTTMSACESISTYVRF